MNELQQVFCAITGYEKNKNYKSAHDEYYFELKEETEKKTQIYNYAINVLDICLNQAEVNKIYTAIEKHKNSIQDGNFSLNQDNAFLNLA